MKDSRLWHLTCAWVVRSPEEQPCRGQACTVGWSRNPTRSRRGSTATTLTGAPPKVPRAFFFLELSDDFFVAICLRKSNVSVMATYRHPHVASIWAGGADEPLNPKPNPRERQKALKSCLPTTIWNQYGPI
ncbi:unnamed protein product [Rangifer tarandus platyrhynchus]|uniref:Uncharacterized protein n=2 Tax=Rangifer tarandus platyrhynchus TaxID=3082113 RepID=A0ACB0E5J2_RANTA|nr:unnamed protein product [Rangifer tarandus platyrhynchus]CAI9695912.1 unnamed protein product [Rangifer tarandus platyrhynchus]